MENETYSLTTCSYTVSLHLLFLIFWLTGTHSHPGTDSHRNLIPEEEKVERRVQCGKQLCGYQEERRRKGGGAAGVLDKGFLQSVEAT